MNELYKETQFILNKYKISANKKLGQNFLINEEVVQNIINSSNITENDLVIEIGPGLGTLTKEILNKAGKLICVELDTKMIKILNDRFSLYNNFELLNQDILKTDLKTIIHNEKKNNNLKTAKIIANLPYYITTPIIMKLLEEKLDLESITVMVQKEVAERLIAVPGPKEKNTGAISYTVLYYASSQKIMEVDKESFIPAPEVQSEVIKLDIRKDPIVKVKKPEYMFKIIKFAFMQRRKTILNSLTNANIFKNKEEGIKILEEIGLSENVRAENLSIEDFAKIADLNFI